MILSLQVLDDLKNLQLSNNLSDEKKYAIKTVLQQLKNGNTFDVNTSLPKELKKYGSCGLFNNTFAVINYKTKQIEITFMEDKK